MTRRPAITQILLMANFVAMSFSAWTFWNSSYVSLQPISQPNQAVSIPSQVTEHHHNQQPTDPPPTDSRFLIKAEPGDVDSSGIYFVQPKDGEKNFYQIGETTGTDKTAAPGRLPGCLNNDSSCTRPSCVRPECRPWGHHYDTIYQQRLGPYSRDNVEPFQFLEIGFYNGKGYDLYREFLPQGECHSIEIACIAPGPRKEGKWPWGNFAEKNPRYHQYLDERRLHCGDGSDVVYLDHVWKTEMNRTDAPPLKIVVDDGAHLSEHMAQTVFFWFPRIEPRGLLIVEDIQPIQEANAFRTQFLPQIMKDLHFCGDPNQKPDELCFPTLFPFLGSIHCEMHICVFERNDTPAEELSLEESKLPSNALDLTQCKSEMAGHW